MEKKNNRFLKFTFTVFIFIIIIIAAGLFINFDKKNTRNVKVIDTQYQKLNNDGVVVEKSNKEEKKLTLSHKYINAVGHDSNTIIKSDVNKNYYKVSGEAKRINKNTYVIARDHELIYVQ